MRSSTDILVEFITKCRYQDIPSDVVDNTKDCILDALGCMIGGIRLSPAKAVINLFTEIGGSLEAHVLATGYKLPCSNAAYVNSYLCNLLDFDDTSISPLGHPGATIIPSGLAVAEKLGVNGRELITAIVVAYEAWSRIALATAPSPERFAIVWGLGTHQIFGAAIVSSKLLGLNNALTTNALGLAGVNAPVPNCRKMGIAPDDRPISWAKNNFGWASMGGILAALLSQRGFIGNNHIFEGDTGFSVMSGSDRFDSGRLVQDLGKDYFISKVGFKPYASCRMTHSTLDAINAIMSENTIEPQQIKTIRISTFSETLKFCSNKIPSDILEAQFSLPYLVALELLSKSSSKGLSEEDLTNPVVHLLAEKVSLKISPELDRKFRDNGALPTFVVIELKDGSKLNKEINMPKWDVHSKPSRAELCAKFTNLVEPIFGTELCEMLMDSVISLDKLDNISTLAEILDQIKNKRQELI